MNTITLNTQANQCWEEQEQSPLLSLPKELLELILMRISFGDIAYVALVCKQLEAHIENPFYWRYRCQQFHIEQYGRNNNWKEACKSFVLGRRLLQVARHCNEESFASFYPCQFQDMKFLDQQTLVTVDKDGMLRVLDAEEGEEFIDIGKIEGKLAGLGFYRKRYIFSFSNGYLQAFDLTSFSEISKFSCSYEVRAVCVH